MARGALVTIAWEREVVAVRRVERGPIELGESIGSIAHVPCGDLSAPSWRIATVGESGVFIHPPPGARVRRLATTAERRGAHDALAPGESVEIEVGRFVVWIAVLDRGDHVAIRRGPSGRGALDHVVLAAALHVCLLGWARAAPADWSADEVHVGDWMRDTLAAAERRASIAPEATHDGLGTSLGKLTDGHPGDGENAGGARAAAEQGRAGAPSSRASGKRFAAPSSPLPPAPARESGVEDFTATMVGLIAASARSQAAAFGSDLASAGDPLAAVGSMWAPALGEAFGGSALGLSGAGLGGGGEGKGVGLGAVGGLGHGAGAAGLGTGGAGAPLLSNRLHGWVGNHAYRCIGCSVTVSGRLPPEAVRRIVRQNMGRIRFCYEAGLRSRPSLAGRVTTRFVISRDGSVGSVAIAESTLGDRNVEDCVARAFSSMSFPRPEGGVVTVVYPILMSSDAATKDTFSFE